MSPHHPWCSGNFTKVGPWHALNLLAFPFSFLSFHRRNGDFLRFGDGPVKSVVAPVVLNFTSYDFSESTSWAPTQTSVLVDSDRNMKASMMLRTQGLRSDSLSTWEALRKLCQKENNELKGQGRRQGLLGEKDHINWFKKIKGVCHEQYDWFPWAREVTGLVSLGKSNYLFTWQYPILCCST